MMQCSVFFCEYTRRFMSQYAYVKHRWNLLYEYRQSDKYSPSINVRVDGDVIKPLTTFKYFDLVLDEGMPFYKHVWRNGKYIPTGKRKQEVYFDYAQCHFIYMLLMCWMCSYKIIELQTIQKKYIKALYRRPRDILAIYLYSSMLAPFAKLV